MEHDAIAMVSKGNTFNREGTRLGYRFLLISPIHGVLQVSLVRGHSDLNDRLPVYAIAYT